MRTLPTGTVTFLFTDIQGSTELLHHLGDERYGEVLLAHQRLLRAAFVQEDGAEVDTQGDAFFYAFPRAWNAVAAAAASQQALASHPWPEGVAVRVRMGIHTGEPTLVGDHYVGLDVHRAARIAATGHGGQVLLSERAQAMAQGRLPAGVDIRDLGEHRLKDLVRPEHIYQLRLPGLPADFPPLKSLEVLVTNLPSEALTSFVGRQREMAEVSEQLAASRLLTLLGAGGTGKTRLALEVGSDLLERFPQGVWLVELAPLADPGLVAQTVAAVFNVREAPGRPLQDSLIDYLKPREALLILDNCEHLIASTAGLADAVLRACPKLRVLATSREPLGVTGEATYQVPPLSRPDPARRITAGQLQEFEATRLFVERALASNPRFVVTDTTAPVVARLSAQLDGIPLALELAAARVKVLGVEQIAARLDDRFRLLAGGARTGLPHHQTLRAAIDWSHDLLVEPERTVFRRLAAFAGGFSLEAAEAVGAGGEIDSLAVLDLVARLVDKSLLVTEEIPGDIRYRMLETIRAYSREKLAAAGEEEEVRGRHLQWHLALAEEAEPHLSGPEQITWLDRLERDHDDLRAALAWTKSAGEGEAGLRLAGTLHRFWARRGYLSEGREWLEEALARAAAPPPVRARALYGAGVLAFDQGDYARAQALCEDSLRLYRDSGDDLGAALALNVLGRVARNHGEYGRAVALLEESEALSRPRDHRWALAEALNNLAVTARRQRDLGRASGLLEEGLALWRALGDKWGLAATLAHLGLVVTYAGDYARARALLNESLVLRRELGDRRNMASGLNSLGTTALMQGDFDQARSLFEEGLPLFRELGDKTNIAAALGNLGVTLGQQGDLARATAVLEESLQMCREMGDRLNTAVALTFLALTALLASDPGRAAALYAEALGLFLEHEDRMGVAECLVGVAAIALDSGAPDRAARLLGAVDALHEALDMPIPPWVRPRYTGLQSALRARLGEQDLAAAGAEGRAMSLDRAVREALTSLTPPAPAPQA